ncbi:MAG TPA: ABC transporter substrate-binding protein [Candidatus Sulfotelmatobacter sp.]|nr:ABC transporter substrate-binding protein [Candidatus Sulfotelmatobacter sp.]
MRKARAVWAALLVAAAAWGRASEGAEKPIRVGLLKLSTSAPLFIAMDRGYFRDEGLNVEFKWFGAAQPIAVAVAAREVEVGATGLTAGLYNLFAGGVRMSIVADKGREAPGFPLNGFIVRKELYDQGVRSLKDLKGKKIGITQVGSTFHYQVGKLLEAEGLSLKDVEISPLRTMTGVLEAMQGGGIDAAMLPQPFPAAAEGGGIGKVLFWAGDKMKHQIAAIFYSEAFRADRERGLKFMKAYVRASRAYHDAVLRVQGGRPVRGRAYEDVLILVTRYTEQPRDAVAVGLPYQDRDGRLLAQDIPVQIRWFAEQKMIDKSVDAKDVVDLTFQAEAVKVLGH